MSYSSGYSSSSELEDLPTILIVDAEVALKQRSFVARVPAECYWFGFVKPLQLQHAVYLHLYDIAIPKQEVSSASVDLESTVNELMEELAAEEKVEQISDMKFFAHSHDNFKCYHSGTDQTQIKEWAELLETPWFISHVQNKKRESTTRLDQFKPFRMCVNHLRLEELMPVGLNDWTDKQIEEKVTKKTAAWSTSDYSTNVQSGTFTSPPITTENIYTTAWEHYIRYMDVELEDSKGNPVLDKDGKVVTERVRQRIVNGFIIEDQTIGTGERTYRKYPTTQEQEAMRIKLGIKEDVHVIGRKAKSTDKPGNIIICESGTGKAAARDWRKEHGSGTHHQTQIASAAKSESANAKNEKNKNEHQKPWALLPRGVDSDEIVSEERAAVLQSTLSDDDDNNDDENMERVLRIMNTPPDNVTSEDHEFMRNFEAWLGCSLI
jgi:hypothetical protein